jgi:tetratricopeptide (TPR) repeat protein
LTHLACAWQGLRNHEKAIRLCRDAIALGRSTPLHHSETLAAPLDVLATCLLHLGHTGDAIACWQEAATVYDDAGYPHEAAEVRQHLHDTQIAPKC